MNRKGEKGNRKGAFFALFFLLGMVPFAPWAGEGKETTLQVEAPVSWETPQGAKAGAAVFTVKSKGRDDRLIGARADAVCGHVEIHEMVAKGDMRGMRRIRDIPLPADRAVTLGPEGYHLMLMDLKAPLAPGESYDLILMFEKAGEKTVRVLVRPFRENNHHR